MFSGKTEELIRRVRRALYARQSVQVFKPLLDTRTEETVIQSHNGRIHEAMAVADSQALLESVLPETQLVAIEEVQFLDSDIVRVCQELVKSGKNVVLAGLDLDFRGCPFGSMPTLLAIAEEVVKLRAICARCGGEAWVSQRLIDGKPAPETAPVVLIGATEHYEARCRHCHEISEIS
jgi:thymidine kinase